MSKLKSSGYALFAFIVAVVMAAAGYVAASFISAKDSGDADISAVAAKVSGNVFEVKCGDGIATGFVLESDGKEAVAVTAWHTVKGDPTVAEFKFSDSGEFERGATLIGFDPDYDVAVYKIETDRDFATLTVRELTQTGEETFLLGNSKGDGIALFSGRISVPDDIVLCSDSASGSNINGKSLPAVRITAPINYGSSGAPVFDKNGCLVGMGFYQVFGTTERPVYDMNFAVPSVIIKSLVAVYNFKTGETPRSPVTLGNYVKGEGEFASRVYEAKFKKLWTNSVFYRENGAIYRVADDGKKKVLSVAGRKPSSMAEFLAAAIDYEIFGGDCIVE